MISITSGLSLVKLMKNTKYKPSLYRDENRGWQETEIGEIPEGWEVYELRDLVEKVIDNRGKTPPTGSEGIDLLEVNAVTDGEKFPNYTKVRKYISNDTYKTWFRSGHPRMGDILVPTVGTIGNVAIMSEDRGTIAQNLIALRINKSASPDYIYYLLSSSQTKEKLLNLDIGGVQPSIKVPHLLNLDVTIPDIAEQQSIASILSSLDDKIELNRKMNKTLEEMGKALFKRWFVDFEFPDENGKPYKSAGGEMVESELGMIPKGWSLIKLGTFFPVKTGKQDAKIAVIDGKYPFFTCAQEISRTNKYSFDESALLLAGNGDFNVKWYEGKFEAYQRTYVLTPYNSDNLGFLYYLVDYFLNEITSGHRGSVINFITKGMIENFSVALPVGLNSFLSVFNSLNKLVDANKKDINRLGDTRDLLLPRLMSGRLRV